VCGFGTSWINQALDMVSDEEHARQGHARQRARQELDECPDSGWAVPP